LCYWKEKFNPDKEDLSYALVWARLYALPKEYWDEKILAGIGNTLGTYLKSTKETKQWRYATYARICIYMNVLMPIHESIFLTYQDSD
jgi:hypothetical protein